MPLNDAEIGAIALKMRNTLKSFFAEKQGHDNTSDSVIADFLLTGFPESFNDKGPEGYSELETTDKHRVIERTIASLKKGNGLVFSQSETPQWLRVSNVEQGRTPLKEPGGYRWIRLCSIDQVIPKVALGVSEDIRGWGWNLQVKTNTGETFYASDETYRGDLINPPQNALMAAIESAIKASHEPAALSKLA